MVDPNSVFQGIVGSQLNLNQNHQEYGTFERHHNPDKNTSSEKKVVLDQKTNHVLRSNQTQSTSYSLKGGVSDGKRSLNASNGMPV